MPPTIRSIATIVLAAAIPTATQTDSQPASRPVAVSLGTPVRIEDLQAPMFELAGAVALEELTLDRALRDRLAKEGLTIGEAAIDAERTLLIETVAAEANASPEQAGAMIESMRAARGLGPVRYRALLTRNAGLRALVRESVKPSQADLDAAFELEAGARFRVRVLITRNRQDADNAFDALKRAKAAGTSLPAAFAELAFGRSLDPSGPRGGLYPELSPADGSLPAPIRAAVRSTAVGDYSDVLVTERGFGLVLVEGTTPAKGEPSPEQRRAIEAKLRRRLERFAMDRLAKEMVETASVSVMDESLRSSWDGRAGARR